MKKHIIPLIFLVILIIIPPFLSGYMLRILTAVVMFATLTEAINIIAGYAGYPAFGNVVFFGMGAYVTAILMNHGFGFYLTLIPSIVTAVLFAVVIGFPVLRLRGHYFAIASLGVNVAVMEIVNNLKIAGAAEGLTLPLKKGANPHVVYTYFYYLFLVVLVLSVIFTIWLEKNRFGFGLRAIRVDEDGALAMGINTPLYKTLAWSYSAVFTALVGSIYAYWISYIDPETVFDPIISVKMFVMMLIGGASTVYGPLIGAVLLELIAEVVWSKFVNIHGIVLGAIIILTVILIPKGFLDLFTGGFSWRRLVQNIKENMI